MEVISLPRGMGKSSILVCESSRTNIPIITSTKVGVEHLQYIAKRMEVTIPQPIIASSLSRKSLEGQKYYIDDIDEVWATYFGGSPIIGSLTPTNEIEY